MTTVRARPISAVLSAIAAAIAVTIGAATPTAQATPGPSADAITKARLERIFSEYWEKNLESSPTWATYLGDHRWNDRLADESADAYHAWTALCHAYLRRSQDIDAERLSAEDRLSKRLFERSLTQRIEEARFEPFLLAISQQDGIHIGFPQIVHSHPFRRADDYWNYAARLTAFGRSVEQTIAKLEQGIEKGIVPPRVTVAKVVPQIEALIVADPKESPLWGPLAKEWPREVSPASRAGIEEAIAATIRHVVVPAYRRLRDFVRDRYLPACRETVGTSALPDGEERYAFQVRRYTTTDRSPREIHSIGLREVARIRGEMEEIKKSVGFEGDLGAFFEHLRTDERYYCKTPQELEDGYRAVLKRAEAMLPKLFGTLPKAKCDLRRIEAYREASAPTAYYYSPPLDGSRPGYFYYNAYDLSSRPKYDMEALTYHEAVPGHHLQICLSQERQGVPEFRKHLGFTVFVEGWALYSEALAKEVGGYADPISDFGRLTYEAWRACRLVVDTGIHAMGWSRERAIEYMKQNTGLTETNIVSEVERYIAWPGQALAYKTGQMAILGLRREAEAALGARFDVRRFHDHLLGAGSLPLDVLEDRMRAWLRAEMRRTGKVRPKRRTY